MTKLKRRGERLARLAYELESLAADARHDGFDTAANGLREAARAARYAGDEYLANKVQS